VRSVSSKVVDTTKEVAALAKGEATKETLIYTF
jgi:hypothetical protein